MSKEEIEATDTPQGVKLNGIPSLTTTQRAYLMARERHLTAMGAAHMEGSIRHIFDKLLPYLKPECKAKAFSLVAIALVTAWKKGCEHGQRNGTE